MISMLLSQWSDQITTARNVSAVGCYRLLISRGNIDFKEDVLVVVAE